LGWLGFFLWLAVGLVELGKKVKAVVVVEADNFEEEGKAAVKQWLQVQLVYLRMGWFLVQVFCEMWDSRGDEEGGEVGRGWDVVGWIDRLAVTCLAT
jgi:hypothetical protein